MSLSRDNQGKFQKIAPSHADYFIRLTYPDTTNNTIEISTILNCNKNYAIQRASKIGCIREKQRYKTYLVHNWFFDIESPEKYYILGFLMADGNVTKKYTITLALAIKDKDILEKIKSYLCSALELKIITKILNNKKYQQIKMSFNSKLMYQQLCSYGIIPHKTGKEYLSNMIPQQYIPDFIRGFFDGDGTCASQSIKITSASETIITQIYNYFNFGTINKFQRKPDKITYLPMYTWRISKYQDFKQFFDICYYDDCLCLSRKKQKLIDHLNFVQCQINSGKERYYNHV